LAGALILSLGTVALMLLPIIGYLGITQVGWTTIKEGTVASMANQTFWTLHANTWSALSLSVVIPIMFIVLFMLGLLLKFTEKAFRRPIEGEY